MRLRSIDNVIAEIESVRAYNPSLKYVNIYDDTFTLNMNRVREFCSYMKNTDLFWTCEAHVLTLCHNPEMIHVMAESGLIAVQLGIESGSQRVLNAYNKHITPEMIIDVYIIGGAFESEETLAESISHAKKLITAGRGIVELNTVFFAPYYGTPITQTPELYGMCIDSKRMQHMIITMREAVINTETLSTNDIVSAKRRFEAEMRQHYIHEAAFTTKDELLRSAASGRIVNYSWLNAWRNYPQEQECSSCSYPVRTMSEYILDGDSVSEGVCRVSGIYAKLLMLADGKRQIHDIAEYTCLSLEAVINIYRELNDKCLVYFAEF